MNASRTIVWISLLIAGLLAGRSSAVNMETVTVGNPGNAGELSGQGGGGLGPDRICGAVGYAYKMAKFEVTAGQYAEFLNAVAKTDTYGLYSTYMDSESWGCQITRNGTDGNYTYDFSGRPSGTEADWANRPVNCVSWGDAARFANWLTNGQKSGSQDSTTTEDGLYYLNGAMTNEALAAVTRKPGVGYAIPTEDEWYKAAYYDPNYGGPGVSGYWDYPTSSNSMPSNVLGNPTDPGNNATFWDNGYVPGSPYWRTEVGAHENSASPYDTFDQGGNVFEWTETRIYSVSRVIRGGSFTDNVFAGFDGFQNHAGQQFSLNRGSNNAGLDEWFHIGIRVAEVPEPGTMLMLALAGVGIIRRTRA